MSQRFYSETPITAQTATLEGPEAHHLLHVMRASVDDEVVLFDGSGAEFTARVVKIGRVQVEVQVVSRQDVDRELPFELTLGVALPKGDRQRWLVEKAVEIGVSRLVPLTTARSVARPDDKSLSRLRRAVIEASKQCGRNRLMQVAAPSDLGNFVQTAPPAACRLICHPDGEGRAIDPNARQPVYLAVGPEGGFTDDELSAAAANQWQMVRLGPRILRTETAALALAAIVALP